MKFNDDGQLVCSSTLALHDWLINTPVMANLWSKNIWKRVNHDSHSNMLCFHTINFKTEKRIAALYICHFLNSCPGNTHRHKLTHTHLYLATARGWSSLHQAQNVKVHVILTPTSQTEAKTSGASLQIHTIVARRVLLWVWEGGRQSERYRKTDLHSGSCVLHY